MLVYLSSIISVIPTPTDVLMSFFILYVKFPEYPSLPDGSELEDT